MKNKIKILSLSLLLASLMSCTDDLACEQQLLEPEYAPVHFKLKFNSLNGQPDTRSLAPGYKYADGSSISVLKCYVYNTANGTNALPSSILDIDIQKVNGQNGGDVTILLPKGEKYDVVFLGTSIPQTDTSSKMYYDTMARTLNLNYSHIYCNDEEIDCFFATQEDVTTETVLNQTIELTRPLAQINIGTQDYAEYIATKPVKDIAVSVDGVYNTFNLMSGEVTGNAITAEFKAAAVPTGQTFPTPGYAYLSMNYVLVNQRKLIDMTVTVNHTNSSIAKKEINIPGVAVERNYQTNIYGKKLLTEEIQL